MTSAHGMAESVVSRGLHTLREEGLRAFLLKALFVLGYRRAYVLRRSLTEAAASGERGDLAGTRPAGCG